MVNRGFGGRIFFGFDTVVISRANQAIKELWQTSPIFHGFFIMSMALWSTVVGAHFGGIPAQGFGLKKVFLWVGINFILYYAPEILKMAGLATKESFLISNALGSTNLFFAFVGLYLIDRPRRKTPQIIGSIGFILCLLLVSYAFYAHTGAFLLMTFGLLFIATHAIGQGAVIWVFISEIFPTKIRSAGQSFRANIHWVFAAIITLITLVFLDKDAGIIKENPWPILPFFAGMMILQLIWVLTRVPETKGISLEELEKKLMQ